MARSGDSSSSEEYVAPPTSRRGANARGKAPASSSQATTSRGRTKVRATKRGRGAGRVQIDRIAGYESVAFVSEDQRDRFGVLMDEPFEATRWLSADAMRDLRILTTMHELFIGTGFTTVLSMNYLTYKSITLEFLSSFEMNPNVVPVTFSFRVLNRNYELSINDFANHLGLTQFAGRHQAPEGFDPLVTWHCMSRKVITNFNKVKINDIEHPVLRLWFRTLAGTYFGRPEVGVITREEIRILGRYLNVQQQAPWGLNIPFLVANHIVDVATSKIKTIRIGGIITCLIRGMGIQIPTSQLPVRAKEQYIDLEFLRTNHHWYHSELERHRWLVSREPRRWMTLPCARLPPIVPFHQGASRARVNLPSYLIPEDLVYALDQQMPQVQPENPLPELSAPSAHDAPRRRRRRASPYHDDDDEAGPSSTHEPPSAQEITTAQFNFTTRQNAHIAANNYLWGLPDYHERVLANRVQPPYVSYYRYSNDPSGIFEELNIDPNAWGPNYGATYGGCGGQFLDEFGRLRVEEDAPQDEEDDDDDEEEEDDSP